MGPLAACGASRERWRVRRFPDTRVSVVTALASDDIATRERATGAVIEAYRAPVIAAPDGNYLIGRSSVEPSGVLRVVRISDGANVTLRFPGAQGVLDDYYQPDWR